MSQKFSIRVNDPKGFARAFKLARECCRTTKYGNPSTSNVLLRVEGFKAVLQATDLEQYLTIDLGIAGCGAPTLEGDIGALFLPRDWKVPNEPFSLEAQPSDQGLVVTLKQGVIETSIPQECDAADYPLFPLGNAGVKFTLDSALIAHQFKQLAPFCAQEKGRYALNGMLFDFEGQQAEDAGPFTPLTPPIKTRLVATDGRRLAAYALPVNVERAPRYQAILYAEHAQFIADVAKTFGGNIEVAFPPERIETDGTGHVKSVEPTSPQMFFSTASFTYVASLVDGQYPNWRCVLPKCDAEVLVPRMEMFNALEAVKKATSVESAAVRLTFNADSLLIEAKSSTNGYAKTKIPLTEVPPQMVLGLDPDYLQDALEALTGDWVVFRFRSTEYGVELHDGAPDLRYHLVMPMDIGDEPAEPKNPGEYVEQGEKWNAKTGKWDKTTPEEKAAAKAEHEAQAAEYVQKMETYKRDLAEYRLHKRLRPDAIDGACEQKHGEFTPRPEGQPAIGTLLAPHPTLAELEVSARAATIAPAKKARVKPSTVAAAPTQPQPVSRRYPEHFEKPEYEYSEPLETAQELGYTLSKNQSTFGW